jgi:ribonuclease D
VTTECSAGDPLANALRYCALFLNEVTPAVQYDTITTQDQLEQLCEKLAGSSYIGFDTEFISEHSYRPELCLVQIAAEDCLAVIDTLAVDDMRPLWRRLAEDDHETIVHAGREEINFSLRAIGRPPANLFDLQWAAGMVGYEYPAGYATLVYKLLGGKLEKGETRTDWRRRPLTKSQLDYALLDVVHLKPMRDLLGEKLTQLGRVEWLEMEKDTWVESICVASTGEGRWRRVSGSSGLKPRSLAIVREIWKWREKEAERRDCSVRRVLRDDLIVELAKRRSDQEREIGRLRGMERGDLKRVLPELAECVGRALKLQESELPKQSRSRRLPYQVTVLGQFLSPALSYLCRSNALAVGIVGTTDDVRELIAHRLGYGEGELPALASGWRGEIVGKLLDDLIEGRRSIRVHDPKAEEPLAFEPFSLSDPT